MNETKAVCSGCGEELDFINEPGAMRILHIDQCEHCTEQLRQQRDELAAALEEQVLANGQPTESELERARQALANTGKEE